MTSITFIIIGVTVAISIWAFNNAQVFQKCLMNPFMVFNRREYWRLITSGFIHGNYIHLGFNMFTFYFFGRLVEIVFRQIIGSGSEVVFVLFYISAIILSDLPGAWKKKDILQYNSLGASGAVSAMVFASIIYFPLEKIYLFGIIGIPGFILGILYLIYSYFQGKNLSDGVNHEAHLYGAIYGAIFAIAIFPQAAPRFVEQILSYSPF